MTFLNSNFLLSAEMYTDNDINHDKLKLTDNIGHDVTPINTHFLSTMKTINGFMGACCTLSLHLISCTDVIYTWLRSDHNVSQTTSRCGVSDLIAF